MELLTTYNMTTLIGAAKTASYNVFNAWYGAICTKYGITPLADPTTFFTGAASFPAFKAIHADLISTPRFSDLDSAYTTTKAMYDLGTFIALAPTNTQTSFKTWQEIVRAGALTVPTAAMLAEV